METKICTKCGETKPLSDFHKERSRKSGYRPDCKACVAARWKRQRVAYRETAKKWRAAHPDALAAYQAKFKGAYRSASARCMAKALVKAKAAVYAAYGEKCNCCGETRQVFLTIDHINNDGAEERRLRGSGLPFYSNIIKLGFPKDRYQILCMNCNWAKRYGLCPHEEERRAKLVA